MLNRGKSGSGRTPHGWCGALQVAAVLAGVVLGTAPASAGTVAISGTRMNITPPGVMGGPCVGALTISIGPDAFAAGGTSNLGNFTYTAQHCIAAPPPGTTYDGVWEWTLPQGTLFGTDVSVLTLSATPGVFDVVNDLVILGGSGLFAGASGWMQAVGTVQFGLYEGGPASFGEFTFSGKLSAPAIPEPATWGMMILGFGLVGLAARRRGRSIFATV